MPWGLINPSLKAINKNINKLTEILILMVNALTARFEFPESRMRKISPLANEPAIIIMANMMIILVIICYTPENCRQIMANI